MSELNARGLDPAWVAAQIGAERATFEGFIGTGQIGRNARFSITGHAASSVVVKVPAEDPGVRQIGFDQGLYPKECLFYREVVDLVEVSTPRPLAVDIDPDTLDFALVLEDMAGSEAGDQFSEATDDELTLAVEQAASLHGPSWGARHPALEELRGGDEGRDALAGILKVFLPMCLDRLGGRLDADTIPVLRRFVELATVWLHRPIDTEGLVHADFRPDNFLFGRTADAPPLAVVDWQTLTIGASVSDVAYLLGAAIEPARRREVERHHLATYRNLLAGHGVDYPADRCWDDYALASLHGIVVGITATIMATETDRGNNLFALMLNRHARHALDVEALDRLAALA
ncbi:MAG: phosphotransferase [Actinomycetota bacterium]